MKITITFFISHSHFFFFFFTQKKEIYNINIYKTKIHKLNFSYVRIYATYKKKEELNSVQISVDDNSTC